MEKIVIEDKIDWKREDGGATFVSYPIREILDKEGEENEDTHILVRIISWDDNFYCGKRPKPKHDKFMQMVGKRVRVTIELLEE